MYSFAITFFERVNFKYILWIKKEFTPLVMDKLKEKQT